MQLRERVQVTPSKFAMWRAAIALAYSDHRLSNSEIDLIWRESENFDFSDAHRAQLEKDMQGGIALDDVWDQITEKGDRAHLINFSLVLFHVDGEFSQVEQILFEEINARHMLTIDYRGAVREAKQSVERFLAEDKDALERDYKNESLVGKAFHYIAFWDER